jgi:DNA-binding NarL/FixJ family response regulator
MIVPGKNLVLNYLAQQMEGLDDVQVLSTANDVLWQARQTPPRIVLSDVQLDDMSGAELAEILPNFAPNTRTIICGQASPTTVTQIQSVGAQFVALDSSSNEAIRAVYAALDMDPPSALPTTGQLREAPPATATAGPSSPPPARPVAPQQATPQPSAQVPSSRPAEPRPAVQPQPQRPRPVPVETAPREAPIATPAADVFANSNSLVIQPQQYQVLIKLLDLVAKEVGAQAVMLIDPAGMVLVQSGSLPGMVMELIGPMLATSFSTTGQLARHLQEQNTNATYVHEGDRYDIYAFNISYRVTLLIMFDKRIAPGKLGTVWVYAKRAMKQLQQILKL